MELEEIKKHFLGKIKLFEDEALNKPKQSKKEEL